MRFWILILLACLSGCHTISGSASLTNDSSLVPVCDDEDVTVLPVPPGLPRELNKTAHPDYIIEPPDILRIEVARVIPKSPYFLGPGDGLLVQVTRPVSGPEDPVLLNEILSVELDGSLQFGSPFDDPNGAMDPSVNIDGPINVMGLSVADARRRIVSHVQKTFPDVSIRVSLSDFATQQPISGEHLVAADGTVNLGTYGRAKVVGLTVDEARMRINEHLSMYLQNPNASVDVFAYNSKTYYIILQGAGLGDRVAQFPVVGNETVLDALSNVEGLSGTSSDEIWLSRPGRNIFDGHQVLPVHWGAITQLADVTTNYQILPGDRVFVREDSLIAMDTHLGKIISPIERLLGVVLLGTNTVSQLDFYQEYGQSGGRGNNFGP